MSQTINKKKTWYDRYIGHVTKVSFYTYKGKFPHLLDNLNATVHFSDVVAKFYHLEPTEIVLSLHLWYVVVTKSFLKFSHPFLRESKYEPSMLEKAARLSAPFHYRLYIPKHYCSKFHLDNDLRVQTFMHFSHSTSSKGVINSSRFYNG
jgi:hypothetical protein